MEALANYIDGTKAPVGLWAERHREQTVVIHLLADLVDQGPSADGGLW